MTHKEYSLTSHDGLKLFAQSWSPDDEIKKIVMIIHGHGDHSTRYDHWAERFVKNGYAVVGIDLRGHGKSEGKKGYIPDYDSLLNDVELMINETEKLFPEKEKILYGQSMGGNLVINYCLKRESKIKAVIASSPWLKLAFEPTKLQLFLANLGKKLVPKLTQSTKLSPDDFSHDKYEVEKCNNDKLFHDKISSMLYLSIVEHGEIALEQADNFKIPLLLLHGSGDKVTSHKATESFYQKAQNVASIKIFEGCYHELHHEFEREQVFQHILDWLNKLK